MSEHAGSKAEARATEERRAPVCVLIVAGLDPSGGAGLVADVALVRALGLHPAAVASALTEQDSARCHASHAVDPTLIARQLARLVDDLPIAAVKVGMLGSAAVAAAVARALGPLARRGVPIVVDPVLRASVGADLLEGDPRSALAPVLRIATLITPNRDEAAVLAGFPVEDAAAQGRAARALRSSDGDGQGNVGDGDGSFDRARRPRPESGTGAARAVLVKGGHFDGATSTDLLDDGGEPLLLSAPRIAGPSVHGTGCALSTTIAVQLALGRSLREAVIAAHAAIWTRIATARSVGRGRPFLGDPSSV